MVGPAPLRGAGPRSLFYAAMTTSPAETCGAEPPRSGTDLIESAGGVRSEPGGEGSGLSAASRSSFRKRSGIVLLTM